MSAGVESSNNRNSSISHYDFSLKSSPEAQTNGVPFSLLKPAEVKNSIRKEKKDKKNTMNSLLVRAVDYGEEDGSWINATGCGGPRWKGREAVFKVVADLAQEIANKDGEIEILRERAAEQDKFIRELLSISRSHMQLRFNFMKFAKYFIAHYSDREIGYILCEQLELFRKQEDEEVFHRVFSKELSKWSYYKVFPKEDALEELRNTRESLLNTPKNDCIRGLPSTSYDFQVESVQHSESPISAHNLLSNLHLDASNAKRAGSTKKISKGQKDDVHISKAASTSAITHQMKHTKAHPAKVASAGVTDQSDRKSLYLSRSASASGITEKPYSSVANCQNNFLQDLDNTTCPAEGCFFINSKQPRTFLKPGNVAEQKLSNLSNTLLIQKVGFSESKSQNDSMNQNGLLSQSANLFKRSFTSAEDNPPPKLLKQISEEDIIVLSSDEES